jgi:hypothetical protein
VSSSSSSSSSASPQRPAQVDLDLIKDDLEDLRDQWTQYLIEVVRNNQPLIEQLATAGGDSGGDGRGDGAGADVNGDENKSTIGTSTPYKQIAKATLKDSLWKQGKAMLTQFHSGHQAAAGSGSGSGGGSGGGGSSCEAGGGGAEAGSDELASQQAPPQPRKSLDELLRVRTVCVRSFYYKSFCLCGACNLLGSRICMLR